jgi:hypothetical protein
MYAIFLYHCVKNFDFRCGVVRDGSAERLTTYLDWLRRYKNFGLYQRFQNTPQHQSALQLALHSIERADLVHDPQLYGLMDGLAHRLLLVSPISPYNKRENQAHD